MVLLLASCPTLGAQGPQLKSDSPPANVASNEAKSPALLAASKTLFGFTPVAIFEFFPCFGLNTAGFGAAASEHGLRLYLRFRGPQRATRVSFPSPDNRRRRFHRPGGGAAGGNAARAGARMGCDAAASKIAYSHDGRRLYIAGLENGNVIGLSNGGIGAQAGHSPSLTVAYDAGSGAERGSNSPIHPDSKSCPWESATRRASSKCKVAGVVGLLNG